MYSFVDFTALMISIVFPQWESCFFF